MSEGFGGAASEIRTAEPLTFRTYCPHGVASYVICSECAERARRERFEARTVEIFDRLAALLERAEGMFAERSAAGASTAPKDGDR